MKKNNKILLPATILIASFILGGFYYISQINKQISIEKQQKIELQAKAEANQLKVQQVENQKELLNSCLAEAKDKVLTFIKNSCTPNGKVYSCIDGIVEPYKKEVNDECFKLYPINQ